MRVLAAFCLVALGLAQPWMDLRDDPSTRAAKLLANLTPARHQLLPQAPPQPHPQALTVPSNGRIAQFHFGLLADVALAALEQSTSCCH